MDNIEVVALVFQSIKQNWAKNGSFQSLVEIICHRLGLPASQEICDFLKKHDALWLNNHLEDSSEEESEDERLEINRAKLGTSEMIGKPIISNTQNKNHDFH